MSFKTVNNILTSMDTIKPTLLELLGISVSDDDASEFSSLAVDGGFPSSSEGAGHVDDSNAPPPAKRQRRHPEVKILFPAGRDLITGRSGRGSETRSLDWDLYIPSFRLRPVAFASAAGPFSLPATVSSPPPPSHTLSSSPIKTPAASTERKSNDVDQALSPARYCSCSYRHAPDSEDMNLELELDEAERAALQAWRTRNPANPGLAQA